MVHLDRVENHCFDVILIKPFAFKFMFYSYNTRW